MSVGDRAGSTSSRLVRNLNNSNTESLWKSPGLTDGLVLGEAPRVRSRLRTRAGRSVGHLESVGPLDEFDRDDEGDDDLVEAVVDEAVGVAAELPVMSMSA